MIRHTLALLGCRFRYSIWRPDYLGVAGQSKAELEIAAMRQREPRRKEKHSARPAVLPACHPAFHCAPESQLLPACAFLFWHAAAFRRDEDPLKRIAQEVENTLLVSAMRSWRRRARECDSRGTKVSICSAIDASVLPKARKPVSAGCSRIQRGESGTASNITKRVPISRLLSRPGPACTQGPLPTVSLTFRTGLTGPDHTCGPDHHRTTTSAYWDLILL